MPNHIHGMLIIDNDRKHDAKTLGVIINQYKRFVTINARLKNINFAWQARFHDHIVRNNDSFQNIQDYIQENPLRWMDDKFYG